MGKTKNTSVRSRTFTFILYPEDSKHQFLLDWYTRNECCVWIKHDKDKWTKEDEKANPEHKCGEYKKEHYHILVRFGQPKTLKSIQTKLTNFYNLNNDSPISSFHIETVSDCNEYIRYMIHSTLEASYLCKYPYKPNELHGNKELISKAISNGDDSISSLKCICDYIVSHQCDFCQITQYIMSDLVPAGWRETYFSNQYLIRNFCYDYSRIN